MKLDLDGEEITQIEMNIQVATPCECGCHIEHSFCPRCARLNPRTFTTIEKQKYKAIFVRVEDG